MKRFTCIQCMRIFLVILILQMIPGICMAQQWLDKVNRVANSDLARKVKDEMVNKMKKSKEEYASADLNLAVSFSDNSGMYENKDKFSKTEKAMLYILSPESYKNRTAKEKAQDLNDVGEMFYASNKYSMALESFKNALALYESEGMQATPEYSLVLSNLGLLYQTTGRYNLSEQYSTEAMNIRMNNPDDTMGLGASYNNLAVLYKDEGKYTESEDYINKALSIIQSVKGSGTSYAIALNNQAILFQSTGKYKDAETILLKAIHLAGNDLKEKSPNYIRMKINLALLYQLQGRYNEAEKIYLDAIETKKKRLGTSHPDYAVLLQNLAALYQLKGDYGKVESNLTTAIDIFKKKFGEQHPSVASAMYDLARYYQFRGNVVKALPLLNRAIQIQRDNLGVHHPSYASSLNALAVLYWQQQDYQSAADKYKEVLDEYLYQVSSYFPAMSEYDKTRFWDKIGPGFFQYNSFAIDAAGKVKGVEGDMYNYHIATKAILFSSTSKVKKQILNSGNKPLISKYKEWIDLKEYIARMYTLSKDELKDDKVNLDSLETAANNLEKELSKLSSSFGKGMEKKTIGWKDIAASLAPGEGCVEILRFKKYNGPVPDTAVYYAAMVVKKTITAPDLVLFRNGNELESSAIAAYRAAMQGAAKNAPFYDTFWGGIGSITGDVKTIYASLDGVYNQINLNTLQKTGGKFLLDEKNIYYVTNTNEIIGLKKLAAQKKTNPFGNKKAFLLGNPHYAKGLDLNEVKRAPLEELPGTKNEIQKINQLLKASGWGPMVYNYDDATEEKIKAITSPAILHIATHGFFLEDLPDAGGDKVFGIEPVKAAENPLLRSGLMLAGADNTIQQIGKHDNREKDDGILNAYEAMVLNLDNTELVVLSACETGLGETKNGEGVYGLQRAFRIAGTSALMISLWEVSDEVTQKLMTSLYKNWISLKDKHLAFAKAQQEIKAQYPEPFYWGAFILIGN